MIRFLVENWIQISAMLTFLFGGGLLGWKLKRIEVKEATATAEQKDTEAVKSMRELYGDFVGDYKRQYEELKQQIVIIRQELNAVKKENIEQRKDLRLLHKENKALREEIGNWREKYNALKLEFDLYKAKDEQILKTPSDGN